MPTREKLLVELTENIAELDDHALKVIDECVAALIDSGHWLGNTNENARPPRFAAGDGSVGARVSELERLVDHLCTLLAGAGALLATIPPLPHNTSDAEAVSE